MMKRSILALLMVLSLLCRGVRSGIEKVDQAKEANKQAEKQTRELEKELEEGRTY